MPPVVYTPESPDNKAIRELRDEVKDLNQTIKKSNKLNKVFTILLIIVAVLQLMVMVFQYVVSVYGPTKSWMGLIFELMILAALYVCAKSIVKEKE